MKCPESLRLAAIAAILLCAGGLGFPLQAITLYPVDVPNFSFENTASAPTTFGTGATSSSYIMDWTINVPNDSQIGVYNDTTNSNLTGGTGVQGAFIQGYYGYYEQDLISGNINDTIKANTTYQLTVAMGVPDGYPVPSGSDAPGVILNILDSDSNVDATTSYAYTNQPGGPATIYYQGTITYADLPQGSMQDFTLSFTTGANPFDLGEAIHLEFSTYNGYNDASVGPVVFDNVRFSDSTVPEPSTYAMLLGGLALLGLCVRHKLA
jgi:hypothetical protein